MTEGKLLTSAQAQDKADAIVKKHLHGLVLARGELQIFNHRKADFISAIASALQAERVAGMREAAEARIRELEDALRGAKVIIECCVPNRGTSTSAATPRAFDARLAKIDAALAKASS